MPRIPSAANRCRRIAPAILACTALASVRCSSSSSPSPTTAQPAPASYTIAFLNSSPGPGGDVVTTQLGPLSMTFSVLASRAIPGAMLEMSLLDPAGRPCGLAYTNPQDLPAATPVTLTNPSGVFVFSDTFANVGCTLPASIASVRVILLTLTGPPDPFLARTEYHAQTFALAYSLREYPQAPTGTPPTPPAISSFTWKNGTPACGTPCPPIPGDPVNVTCVATAADGAEATMLLSIIWDDGTMTSSSRSFPAGATSAPGGASFSVGSTALGQPPRATAECRVINVRRETVSSTIRIPG